MASQVDNRCCCSCRYGFIEGHVVIPRIQPNAICAANNTGVYILTFNTSQYDTYCYNASGGFQADCLRVWGRIWQASPWQHGQERFNLGSCGDSRSFQMFREHLQQKENSCLQSACLLSWGAHSKLVNMKHLM